MKISRRHATLTLDAAEAGALLHLLGQLGEVLDGDADDDVLARLNPSAYRGDAAAQADYAELTAASLRAERDERLAACRAELDAAAGGGVIAFGDPDAAKRWLQTLNELRLAIGTRIGITEDTHDLPDDADPAYPMHVAYHWLTALQDRLVDAVMR